MADDDDEFIFTPPSLSPQPSSLTINDLIPTSTSQNDDVLGSFDSSQSSITLPSLTTNTFHPLKLQPDPFPHRPDPGPGMSNKARGALPLSLFGEVVGDDDEQHVNKDGESNGGCDPNTRTQIGNDDQNYKSRNGSGFDFGGSVLDWSLDNKKGDFVVEDINEEEEDDDDDWEFKDPFSQENGGSMFAGSKVELQQAGQDASHSVDHKSDFRGFFPQSNDLFAPLHGAANKSSEKDDGFGSASTTTNGFMWGAFSGVEGMSNEIGSGTTTDKSPEDKPGSSSSRPQSSDSFSVSHVTVNKTSEVDIGFRPTTVMSTDPEWGSFTGVTEMSNGSGTNETTAKSDEHHPGLSSPLAPPDDQFSALHGAVDNFSSTVVGVMPKTVTNNVFVWDALAGAKEPSNGSETNAATSDSPDYKLESNGYLPPTYDLFAAPRGTFNNSHKAVVEFKPVGVTTNGLMFDAFPGVDERNSNGRVSTGVTSSLDEDDDFGDFVDASQELGLREQEQMLPNMTVEETLLPNAKAEAEVQNGRGALPASLFSDRTEESCESLNNPDELVTKPACNPRNGFSGQGSVNIHDLLSNLYSQSQNITSVDSYGNPVENGVIYPEEEKDSAPLGEDDDWDDNSWEFKGAVSETGVNERPSSPNLGNIAQQQSETSQNLQEYIDFYAKLRVALCFLLSCQLDELKKAQSSFTGIANGKNTAFDDEVQEAHKLIEESMTSEEVLSEKHLERSSCLDEIFEILQTPKFEVVKSECALSEKLQLAVNNWKVSRELLRHAMSTVKSLSLGSACEQLHYASTWSKIVQACAQELRYAASIWNRASEKKVQQQILSDSRGQNYILAIGEIYRAIELLGLSAKIHKAWILLDVPDPSLFFGLLDECRTLWSSSGLEEALQTLLDNGDFGCDETAKAVVVSIKNFRDFDVLAMHSCVFGQHNSICRISLLPQEILPDLKIVLWNGESYFLNLANSWANLISRDPPQLPHLLLD